MEQNFVLAPGDGWNDMYFIVFETGTKGGTKKEVSSRKHDLVRQYFQILAIFGNGGERISEACTIHLVIWNF